MNTRLATLLVCLIVFAPCRVLPAVVSTLSTETLDVPGASSTSANGVDGNNVVGSWTDADGFSHGFLYDGTTYTTLDVPGANQTFITGIDGNNIVGTWTDSNGSNIFVYDGTTYDTIDVPVFVRRIRALGIDGDNIVGWYDTDLDNFQFSGFLYDGSTFMTFGSPRTRTVHDVDGNRIVGIVRTGSEIFGFVTDFMTNMEVSSDVARFYGIDGIHVVGFGFGDPILYDGTQIVSLDVPGTPWAIDGNRIVGSYHDSGAEHGFLATIDLATIPEPTTAAMLTLMCCVGARRARS